MCDTLLISIKIFKIGIITGKLKIPIITEFLFTWKLMAETNVKQLDILNAPKNNNKKIYFDRKIFPKSKE